MKILVWYFHLVHLKKYLENSIHLKILATFFCFFSLVAYSLKDKEKKPRKPKICVAFAIIQKDIFALSLFRLFACLGVYQMPNLFHHRAKYCEYYHP